MMCNRPFDVVVGSLMGISEDQLNKLKALAAKRGTDANALISEAIDAMLDGRPLGNDEVRKIKEKLEELETAALVLVDVAAETSSEL